MKHKLFFTLLFFLVLKSATVDARLLQSETITPDEKLTYKTVEDVNLSLHVFRPEGVDTIEKTPAVVFFFGGGWVGGQPKQFYEQAKYFASLGIWAACAEYRVKTKHNTSPFEAVKDAKSAVRWIREHADELNINPNEIIASGGSAGGHLAACTGIIEGYEEVGENTSVSSVPNAMILLNPVIDTSEKGYGIEKVGVDRKTDISPVHHVRNGIVPTLVMHGTVDKTVPYENVVRFQQKMEIAGNQCQLESYEGKQHGFFNGPYFRKKNADTASYDDTLKKSIAFLERIGFLEREKRHEASSLKLNNLFGDHMVLQQKMPVPVWGTTDPNTTVTVVFANQKKVVKADKKGKWKVNLDPLELNRVGEEMTISSKKETLIIKDVLVGEVWICSGQSNMQMKVNAVPEIRGLIPFRRNIRTFEVEQAVSFEEKEQLNGQWETKHPSSAVAFSFAYFLQDLGDVPVGIIHTSWGSSSIEAWMPRKMVQTAPHFKTIMEEFDADTLRLKRIQDIIDRQGNWTLKENIYARRQPNILYNAMMHPLIPFACKGILWYQGERNTRYVSGMPEVDKTNWFHRVCGMKDYGEVLKKWMLTYRAQWQNEELHFITVMLPGYANNKAKSTINKESSKEFSWAWMRESQMQSLDLPNTSVINTIDLGDSVNIHPKDKLPIGQRGALLAIKNTLGKDIEALGPTLKKVEVNGDEIIVHFNNANGLQTHNGKNPTGFWIADDTQEWVKAESRLEGERVILTSPKLKSPQYVRYAFSGKPKVNLINAIGLPAYPFRTDNWEE